mmetsp:Transcript_25381/g.76223  ORF Transcript_25381/g.76223 Transcript_25381/m.76223 type:complete len:251 (+) Transcript_25381:148-900(+)
MLQEICNAIIVTYAASEFFGNPSAAPRRSSSKTPAAVCALFLLINLLGGGRPNASVRDAFAWLEHGAAVAAAEGALITLVLCGIARRRGSETRALPALLVFAASTLVLYAVGPVSAPSRVPTGVVAAGAFLGALYADVRRHGPVEAALFLSEVGQATLYLAPLYPMMAIGISLIFLVAITVFERLDIPTSYLNMPIYYGCLYGPFASVYIVAKKHILARRYDDLPLRAELRAHAADIRRLRENQRRGFVD